MQPFLRQIAAFLSIQAAICIACSVPGLANRNEYIAGALDKQALLREAPGPRLILVGGSNLAFGMNSQQIAGQLGYHPVNMGLHAGFGLAFMLNQVARDKLLKGDVVVVSMEYQHFGALPDPDSTLVELIAADPENVRFLGREQVPWCLDNGLQSLTRAMHRTLRRTLRLPAGGESTKPYSREGFNEFGDLTGHWDMPLVRPFSASMSAGLKDLPDKSIDQLNRFCETCRKRGVRVYYAFPPIEQGFFNEHRTVLLSIASRIRERLTFPILNDPQECTFGNSMFYDSIYHLTAAGAALRTSQLIADLRAAGIRPANPESNNTIAKVIEQP